MRANISRVTHILTGCVALATLIATTSSVSAQPRSSPVHNIDGPSNGTAVPGSRSVFLEYEDLAKAATQGGRSEIDTLVNHYLLRTIAFPAGPSVRLRLTNAETAFREHKQRAISEADVIKAINRAAGRFFGPSFMRTNEAQIALLRRTLDRRVPHFALVSSCDDEGAHGDEMSPVHAGFLLTFLATQKMMNGAYQLDADVWVRETRDYMKKAELMPGKVRPRTYPVRWQPPNALRAMMSEPPSDSNMFTRLMHGVLDDLGVNR